MKIKRLIQLLLLLVIFSTQAKAQNSTKISNEFVTQTFHMNQIPDGMTEQKIKAFLRNHTNLVAVNECSFNTSNGNLKLSINATARVEEVMKIFYNNQCELSFTDSDGIEKKYEPKSDKLIPVR